MLSRSILILAATMLWLQPGNAAGEAGESHLEAEEAFLREVDDLLRDPLLVDPVDEQTLQRPSRLWHTTYSLGAGFGYTSNALLSADPLGMPFLAMRVDAAFLHLSDTAVATIVLSGEQRRFLGEQSLEDERVFFVMGRAEQERGFFDLGAELGGVHAKQVYDTATEPAPLETQAGFVTQNLPFGRVWVRHYPFPRTAFEWSVRAERAFLAQSFDNYSSGNARLMLSYSLAPGFMLHVAGERAETHYDRRMERLGSGFPLAGTRLRLDTWRAEAILEARTSGAVPLRASLRTFAEDTADGAGGYYSRRTQGLEARVGARWGDWRVSAHGRYEDTPYASRLVALGSQETATHRRRSGGLLLERSFGSWRISGNAQRTQFRSNAAAESYTVNQYEAGVAYSF